MDQITSRFVVIGSVLFSLVAILWGAWEVNHMDNESYAAGYESQMSQKILPYYKIGSSGNFSNISNATAINGGLIPQAMLNGDGTTISGPWGGSRVTITSTSGGTGYQSAWTGVEAKDCATFARSQTPNGGIEVNGTFISVTSTGTDNGSAIANACAGNSGGTATVTFVYTT
ncbi:hypothetical protein K2X14_14230 [Acetobacter sp. TBRC 12305]|uniref:Type 4 secretion system PilS N-terminal domain-containing protein n=1 Tax=Acetobacter garciniae TaxID=2817435 RepID=A0A939HKU6_9PROT|nr:hypothetical protein [Acetobacter garciniae]MBO1326270.1 hypothetical protein [Acetobacter garciniae]MBX0345992.1 hypothetical protein [Acetobacter garciniae]